VRRWGPQGDILAKDILQSCQQPAAVVASDRGEITAKPLGDALRGRASAEEGREGVLEACSWFSWIMSSENEQCTSFCMLHVQACGDEMQTLNPYPLPAHVFKMGCIDFIRFSNLVSTMDGSFSNHFSVPKKWFRSVPKKWSQYNSCLTVFASAPRKPSLYPLRCCPGLAGHNLRGM